MPSTLPKWRLPSEAPPQAVAWGCRLFPMPANVSPATRPERVSGQRLAPAVVRGSEEKQGGAARCDHGPPLASSLCARPDSNRHALAGGRLSFCWVYQVSPRAQDCPVFLGPEGQVNRHHPWPGRYAIRCDRGVGGESRTRMCLRTARSKRAGYAIFPTPTKRDRLACDTACPIRGAASWAWSGGETGGSPSCSPTNRAGLSMSRPSSPAVPTGGLGPPCPRGRLGLSQVRLPVPTGRRSGPEGPRPCISSGSPPPRTAIPWPRLPLAVTAVAIGPKTSTLGRREWGRPA